MNNTLKEKQKQEREAREAEIKSKCQAMAYEKYGEEQVKKWSNEHKGLWYLPLLDDQDNIEALALMKPVTRHVLNYASTKGDEGLYSFLEAAMRECWVAGDEVILDDDDYFIPAANSFNRVTETKKAALLKR